MVANFTLLYIYIIRGKYSVTLGFMEFRNNIHQAVKKMEWIENRKYDKIQIKTVRISFVSVWVYVDVCVCVYVL